jgi:hypothetical protein
VRREKGALNHTGVLVMVSRSHTRRLLQRDRFRVVSLSGIEIRFLTRLAAVPG